MDKLIFLKILFCLLLSLLLLLLILLFARFTFTVEYTDRVRVILRVLGIPIRIYPKKKKKIRPGRYSPRAMARRKKKEERKAEKAARRAARHRAKESGKSPAERGGFGEVASELLDNLDLFRGIAERLVTRLARHLNVRLIRLSLVVATPDAAQTAIVFGIANQTVVYLLEFLDRTAGLKYSKNAEVSLRADFAAQRPRADLKFSLSLHGWHLLDILFASLIEFVRSKAKINSDSDSNSK